MHLQSPCVDEQHASKLEEIQTCFFVHTFILEVMNYHRIIAPQDMIADYSCTCAVGWTGRNCEINIDDCSPNPCQNGGTCTVSENTAR